MKRVSKKPSEQVEVYRLPQRYPMSQEQIIDIAVWLRINLPIRLAKMVMNFQGLPFSLAIREDILEAHEKYIQSFIKISLYPNLRGANIEETWKNVLSFTRCLDEALSTHSDMLPLLIRGFNDLTIEERKIQARIFMDKIISDRLALRLLCNHQFEIVNEFEERIRQMGVNKQNSGRLPMYGSKASSTQPKFIGVFDMKFSPQKLVEQLFQEQLEVCQDMYCANVPELSLKFVRTKDADLHLNDNNQFKYIPHALEYILKEILKNALRAQIKAHFKKFGENPKTPQKHEPVKVVIVCNKYDFVIKVSDKGSGVPHDEVDKIWQYHMTSTGSDGNDTEESSNFFDMAGGASNANDKALFGYGCGLPISKCYAERMGGSLKMESVQGYGTDVFIRMPYLHNEYKQGSKKGRHVGDIYDVLKL